VKNQFFSSSSRRTKPKGRAIKPPTTGEKSENQGKIRRSKKKKKKRGDGKGVHALSSAGGRRKKTKKKKKKKYPTWPARGEKKKKGNRKRSLLSSVTLPREGEKKKRGETDTDGWPRPVPRQPKKRVIAAPPPRLFRVSPKGEEKEKTENPTCLHPPMGEKRGGKKKGTGPRPPLPVSEKEHQKSTHPRRSSEKGRPSALLPLPDGGKGGKLNHSTEEKKKKRGLPPRRMRKKSKKFAFPRGPAGKKERERKGKATGPPRMFGPILDNT